MIWKEINGFQSKTFNSVWEVYKHQRESHASNDKDVVSDLGRALICRWPDGTPRRRSYVRHTTMADMKIGDVLIGSETTATVRISDGYFLSLCRKRSAGVGLKTIKQFVHKITERQVGFERHDFGDKAVTKTNFSPCLLEVLATTVFDDAVYMVIPETMRPPVYGCALLGTMAVEDNTRTAVFFGGKFIHNMDTSVLRDFNRNNPQRHPIYPTSWKLFLEKMTDSKLAVSNLWYAPIHRWLSVMSFVMETGAEWMVVEDNGYLVPVPTTHEHQTLYKVLGYDVVLSQ